MAQTLLLLRHAKSSWDDATLADRERPLAPRGSRAAPMMAGEMRRRGWLPGLALVSPARRARDTWARMRAAWPDLPAATIVDGLYMAAPDAILACLRERAGGAASVVVVGHNPGLEDCAAALAGAGSDTGALARLVEKFPTGAVARFDVAVPWTDIGSGGARLTHLLVPRDLT